MKNLKSNKLPNITKLISFDVQNLFVSIPPFIHNCLDLDLDCIKITLTPLRN